MILPPSMIWGDWSLEQDVAEWVDGMRHLGYQEDWNGEDRPGLAAAVCEALPSNEAPATTAWDVSDIAIIEAMMRLLGGSFAYWFFGPSDYMHVHGRAAAGRN